MADSSIVGKGIREANKNRVSLSVVYNPADKLKSSDKAELGGAEWHFRVGPIAIRGQFLVVVYCKRKSGDVFCDTVCKIRLLNNECAVVKNHLFTGPVLQQYFDVLAVVELKNEYLTNGKNLTIVVDISLKSNDIMLSTKHETLFSSSSPFESDCVLIIEGKHVHILKSFLAMHSKYFKVMFESNFAEKDKNEIAINDVDYNEFVELLAVIYPSIHKITAGNVEPVLKLADRFEILGVIKSCKEFLSEDTSISAGKKLLMAQNYRLGDLLKELAENYLSMADLKELKKNPVYGMLDHQTLGVLSENVINLS